jgi:NAD+ diphosphatase
VRREAFEEVGVRVGPCQYVGSQPWPFPASIMVGFLARTVDDDDGDVVLEPDGEEIREARWWSREDLLEAAGTTLRLPGRTSIARAIIEHWYGGTLEGDW